MTPLIAPAGDNALLAELGELTAHELHAAAQRVSRVDGVIRCTPGHSSLYVVFAGVPDRAAVERALASTSEATLAGAHHTFRVNFDGEDLHSFLAHARLTRDDFLQRVRDVTLTARYLGFRAGFAYLDGWPWPMPRRATSRFVHRGSFAIAGDVAGFYPLDTPGGWNVLGRTNASLDIAPGDTISITPTDEALHFGPAAPKPRLTMEGVTAPLAIVTNTPFDEEAARLALQAAGSGGPVLECAMSGPRVQLNEERVIAWCDPTLRVQTWRAREVAIGRIENGLRGYLAVGAARLAPPFFTRRGKPRRSNDRRVIHAIAGPHDIGLRELEAEVTPHLDRVGIRLRPLQPLHAPADLKSIGMQCGTVQLHPDGSLVAMGPDHPVTGGYLQPMTVLTAERWKLAQLVPGERVRFVVYEPNS